MITVMLVLFCCRSGWSGHKWAQPSEAHLRVLLRHVLTHPEEAAAKGVVARADMVSKYSLSRMGAEIRGHFERIAKIVAHTRRGSKKGTGKTAERRRTQ